MRTILLIVSVFILTSCCDTSKKEESMKTQGHFYHVVYFWLQNPDSQEDRAAFEASLTKFIKSSPYIQTMHVGTPASTDREVIDNSYTYSLILTFANKADQDAYQEEPGHKLFIKESEALWKKVQVYDSENILE